MRKHTRKLEKLGNWNILVPSKQINRDPESSGERNWEALGNEGKQRRWKRKEKSNRDTRTREEGRKVWVNSYMRCGSKKVGPPTRKDKNFTWLIVKSTVRELTRNWTTDIHWESRVVNLETRETKEGMTGYLWYNGSTSFVDGEKLKWEHEDKVKARKKIPRKFP